MSKSEPGEQAMSASVVSLDGDWLLGTDPQNVGREQTWWTGPREDAKPSKVPWIIQDAFPGYHGVAWYWRDFDAPANPHAHGRYLLRFWAVDYAADVWLNGCCVGGHEGGETPFVLDVTDAVNAKAVNRLAVRVLNPTNEPIDGFVLTETPHGNKALPCTPGSSFNHGGVVDSVELVVSPAVRVEDLFVRADPETGTVHVRANVRNTRNWPVPGRLELAVSPAASGETLALARLQRTLPPGDTLVETRLQVRDPRLWELDDPCLYRVTVRVWAQRSRSVDEGSVRCGFREFRFQDGYFRLNGRRVFLRSSHAINDDPVGRHAAGDLLARDLLNVKAMGFNTIRFIAGMATRRQLDLCDEIGLMVCEESNAGWLLEDSAKMGERFNRSTAEMIRRDRNHPSLVIWGLLNETTDGPVFRHAVAALPLVRSLDASRMVLLGSGRWDGRLDIGSICNPGSTVWEHLLGDEGPEAPPAKVYRWKHFIGEQPPGIPATKRLAPLGYCEGAGDAHAYLRVPHFPEAIRFLRTLGRDTKPVYLSEYGVGSAVDLCRVTRHFERFGKGSVEEARFYRDRLDRFMADWERWRMDECFTRPEDFFAQALRKMASQRLLGINAIRSNPNLVGYGLTGTVDQGMTGEGLFTIFRELKPGTVDATLDGLAPLRLCLFAEPANTYRGDPVRLEAVLANEDVLPPGAYPLRLQVFGPDATPVFDRTVTVTIPDGGNGSEPPLALPVFAEEVAIHGPSGRYRFLAALERGAAPTGGEAEFFVADPADMPPVEAEVSLWGEDPGLAVWLAEHGIRARPFSPGASDLREVILVSSTPAVGDGAGPWRELVRRIARGATAVFLSPQVFARPDQPLGWLPLAGKGQLADIVGWVYLKDEWAKRHPIFEGLGCGGLMDYTYYQEMIPDVVFSGLDSPAEAVAGAVDTSWHYGSGLLLAVYNLGAGRFFLNTLVIRENLGRHPAAERLLRNMLRYAARDTDQAPAELPADFDAQMTKMGYDAF